MLKQHQVRQHVTRSLLSPAMAALLRRTDGLHLLDYKEGVVKSFGKMQLGNGIPTDLSMVRKEGYDVDRIVTNGDGTATVLCSKLIGLRYPVAGYSYEGSESLAAKGEVYFEEYKRVQSPARTL